MKISEVKKGDLLAFEFSGNTAIVRMSQKDWFDVSVGLWTDGEDEKYVIGWGDSLSRLNSIESLEKTLHVACQHEENRFCQELIREVRRLSLEDNKDDFELGVKCIIDAVSGLKTRGGGSAMSAIRNIWSGNNDIKVIDKVDLENIGSKHPKKHTKEENKQIHDLTDELAKHKKKIAVIEGEIKDAEKRLEDKKKEYAENLAYKEEADENLKDFEESLEMLLASHTKMSEYIREVTIGLKGLYKSITSGTVVEFSYNGKEGAALMRNPNQYYIAIGLYNTNEDGVTTILDDNEDGTSMGMFPRGTVLREASGFTKSYVNKLREKYANDFKVIKEAIKEKEIERDKKHKNLTIKAVYYKEECEDIKKEIDAIEKEISEKKKELDVLKVEGENMEAYRNQVISKPQNSKSNEGVMQAKTPVEDYASMTHLDYIRNKKQFTDMSYPIITEKYAPWLRFRLMSNVVRTFEKLARQRVLTYNISESYYEEMGSRSKYYRQMHTLRDMVNENESKSGILVFPHQGHRDTLMFSMQNNGVFSIVVIYMREDRLLFYESYSEQKIIGQPRTDAFMDDEMRACGTNQNRLFGWLSSFIVTFLCMENDLENVMSQIITEGGGSMSETHYKVGDELPDMVDVVERDATYYTNIYIDKEIPVSGHVSHRWCGVGSDKYLKEVWIKPYTKQGYHREAQVLS